MKLVPDLVKEVGNVKAAGVAVRRTRIEVLRPHRLEAAPEPDTPATLADLLEGVARRRDRTAFARLYGHYAPRIFGYLLRLGMASAVAEEITQEVMIVAWHKASQFDRRKASPGTWLFRIARNRRIDLARRTRDVVVDETEAFELPDPGASPDIVVDATQQSAIVADALELLPAEQLALVRLAFFEGLSHSEIAQRTGLPLGTVKSRLRLAFSRLRHAIERRGLDAV